MSITIKRKHFTIINNQLLKDPELSMQAKGLYCYVMSNADGWKIHKTELDNHFKNGRDAVRTAWNELEEKGWITSKQVRKEGGTFATWEHTFHDERQEVKDAETPTDTDKTDSEQTHLGKSQLGKARTNNYQSNKNINSNKKQYKNTGDLRHRFENFWAHLLACYKRAGSKAGNKQEAWTQFEKLAPTPEQQEQWQQQLNRQASAKLAVRRQGQWSENFKHACRWLKYREFETAPETAQAAVSTDPQLAEMLRGVA